MLLKREFQKTMKELEKHASTYRVAKADRVPRKNISIVRMVRSVDDNQVEIGSPKHNNRRSSPGETRETKIDLRSKKVKVLSPEQRRERLERKRREDAEEAAKKAKTRKKKASGRKKKSSKKGRKGGSSETRLLDSRLVRMVQPENPAWIGTGRRTSLFGKPNLVVQQNRRGTTVRTHRGVAFNER